MTEDLCYQTVSELSDQIASGDLSPVEVTRAYLERAEQLDSRLASIITLLPARALADARAAEEEIQQGRVRGPLHGIPFGVKDLLDTKGIRTTWGSSIFADRVPDRDSAVIEKLLGAGGVLMAKLSMAEFAGGSLRSNLVEHPHNPWKLDRTTSGSSSGSGAATAAALVGFSIGSETGGSIMGPSASCGVCGVRPTYGRVSRYGCMALAWSLDKLGPMARSAEDCGLVLDAIAGHDPRDPRSSKSVFRFRRDPGPMTGRKVGLVRHELDLIPEENRAVFDRALDVLQQAGVAFEDVELPDFPYSQVYNVTRNPEAGAFYKHLFNDKRIEGQYDRARRADFLAGSMLPASDYVTAQRIRQMMVNAADELLAPFSAIIAPSRGRGAGLIDGAQTPRTTPTEQSEPPRRGAVMTRMANLTGLPGISIPCGFDGEEMPLGLHITARAWDEQSALDIAMAFQRETDFHRRRPGLRE